MTRLLEAIFQRYGHDFRAYSRVSIERRVRDFLQESGCDSIAELILRIMADEAFFERFLLKCSVTVTGMFRDPAVYRSLRDHVLPALKTYPFFKIWHAGCSTGEEAYSLAILLKEEGAYERATIFATDFNDWALHMAKEGIYAIARVREYTLNYQESGGLHSLADYYHAHHDSIMMDKSLRTHITFANHNLVTDAVFGDMNFIMCRNVLIYFDSDLQDRVLSLFNESLVTGGFLCLGSSESLHFSKLKANYRIIDEKSRIYKKTA